VLLDQKLLPYILFEKYIYILALKMSSRRNEHCANCVGSLPFPISECGLAMTVKARLYLSDRTERNRTWTSWQFVVMRTSSVQFSCIRRCECDSKAAFDERCREFPPLSSLNVSTPPTRAPTHPPTRTHKNSRPVDAVSATLHTDSSCLRAIPTHSQQFRQVPRSFLFHGGENLSPK